jgi:Uma2 family endonuclease
MDGASSREVLTHPAPSAPARLHLTRAQFMQMDAVGLFGQDRVELIEGEIFVMSPMGEDHARPIEHLTYLLIEQLPKAFRVRVQLPFAAARDSQPQPDLTVFAVGEHRAAAAPDSAQLVIEVSDSSLEFDLERKATVYARAAVPEYWVLDVKKKVLVVHRSRSGARYRSVRRLTNLSKVTSTAVPGLSLDLRNIFARR